ncbi:uncharacterized protein BKA55DRAFT_717511, partial [Fusarium redolens]
STPASLLHFIHYHGFSSYLVPSSSPARPADKAGLSSTLWSQSCPQTSFCSPSPIMCSPPAQNVSPPSRLTSSWSRGTSNQSHLSFSLPRKSPELRRFGAFILYKHPAAKLPY